MHTFVVNFFGKLPNLSENLMRLSTTIEVVTTPASYYLKKRIEHYTSKLIENKSKKLNNLTKTKLTINIVLSTRSAWPTMSSTDCSKRVVSERLPPHASTSSASKANRIAYAICIAELSACNCLLQVSFSAFQSTLLRAAACVATKNRLS